VGQLPGGGYSDDALLPLSWHSATRLQAMRSRPGKAQAPAHPPATASRGRRAGKTGRATQLFMS